MTKINEKEITDKLKNIGPKLAKKIADMGIDSKEELKKVGVKNIFEKISKDPTFKCNNNVLYLYSLQGAVEDINYEDLSQKTKDELKEYADFIKHTK